jgi:hypothetical protein
MFLFGFSSACYFFYKYRKELVNYSRKNVAITIFVIIELVLALIWPAAIPRLFTPVIPLLIIPLAVYVDKYFNSHEKSSFGDLLILVGLFLIFIISQYILRLQFLVLIKPLLVVVIGLQLINIFAIQKRNFCLFKTTLIFSMLVWSLSTIWLHKDIFKAVVKANKYVQNNLAGTIVYNDVSSVSDWYLNVKPGNDQVAGVYVNMDSRAGRTYEVLEEERADYIMVTNEHNTAMEFNADEVGYLEQITEFRYTIRGKEFFTKILKFNKYE